MMELMEIRPFRHLQHSSAPTCSSSLSATSSISPPPSPKLCNDNNNNPPPPPPPLLPFTPLMNKNGAAPPFMASGGAPPPPPPPGNFNLLNCSFVKPQSVKCIQYQKHEATVTCRWTAINDAEAKDTVFDAMTAERLPDEFVQKIVKAFIKKKPVARMTATAKSTADIALNTLGQKKKMAIEINLKKFKISVHELIRLISSSTNPDVSKDSLGALLKNIPTDDELEPYKTLASSENLSEVDLFCYEVARHPGFKFLIELIVTRQEMKADMTRTAKSIKSIQDAFNEIIANYSHWQTVCIKIWQIGNFLNQKTTNFGAAGFIFNDLNRLFQLNAEETKKTLIEFLLDNMPLLKMDLMKICTMKGTVMNAGKQILDEITGIIDGDLKKVENMLTRLDNIDIDEEMKRSARTDLEKIALHISQHRTSIIRLNDTKMSVFSYLVVKNMSISEFFIYVGEIITTIESAMDRQLSSRFSRQTPGRLSFNNNNTQRFDRHSFLRHSLAIRREKIDE